MPSPPLVPGAPPREHLRSRAALAVGRHALRSHLFFAHFERRARLAPPLHWLPEGVQAAGEGFVGGVLPEPKYQAFRHDLLVASFHPGHRAQWTAHELCHALVGFAYHPGATRFFHVLAAWLAELLPVALWYFFDEADLRRCPRHTGGGPLFQTHCQDCEREAERGPRPEDRSSARMRREGRRFVERELAAMRRSRRLGRPEGTRFATIDLAQDAVGYVAGHGARLSAPEMERFVASFFDAQQGHHASLEALEARVLEVCDAVSEGAKLTPWRATRWDYSAQDIGYRLLGVRAQTDGDIGSELDRILDALAQARNEGGVVRAIERYTSLHAGLGRSRGRARALPRPERLFALGYALPRGLGCDREQIAQGIASACPTTYEALGRERAEMVRAFCAADPDVRVPIGRRFAAFLEVARPGPLSDLARLEAAITHVAPRAPWLDCLDPHEGRGARLRLAPGVEIVAIQHDVLGAVPQRVKRARKLGSPRSLLVLRRSGATEVDVLELPTAKAAVLADSQPEGLARDAFAMEETTLDDLVNAGVLVPTAYADR